MVEEIKKRFSRLNTLIACVSVLVPRKMTSYDGNELTLQVLYSNLNYFNFYFIYFKI